MNFFAAQNQARKATRWLVVIYLLATVLIIVGTTATVGVAFFGLGNSTTPPPISLLLMTALLTGGFIAAATLYKTSRLSAGGGRVAQDMGGVLVAPNVQDPLRRRLRNVVEEMAIASGVPVPDIYVLEEESGINAFAAGFSPEDAVVAVTRGCLETLNRDELQGVIAHEFSHILNGDMRLNIRMMGILFGIMALGIIGRFILRGSHYGLGLSGRRNRGAPVVLVGLGLAIVGWVGVFMARLVKAAVSRQREYLADASAVQFTRQPTGIASALKKIGGFAEKSYIKSVDPEEVSHMLFAGGIARLTSLFATHPPLGDRIRALEPGFTENDYPSIDNTMQAERNFENTQQERASAFAGSNVRRLAVGTDAGSTISASVGNPNAQHVNYAQELRPSIPANLYDAAHSIDGSFLLAIALVVSRQESHATKQLSLVTEQIGNRRTAIVNRLYKGVIAAGPRFRLPLLEVAFPALKNRPSSELEYLTELVDKLVQLDGQIELREYCYSRVLRGHLLQSQFPAEAAAQSRITKQAAQKAAIELIRVVAENGGDAAQKQASAFAAGIEPFGKWAESHPGFAAGETSVQLLDRSLAILAGLNAAGKESMLRAVTAAIADDGQVTVEEAELLRTICATFGCPLPPIIGDLKATAD